MTLGAQCTKKADLVAEFNISISTVANILRDSLESEIVMKNLIQQLLKSKEAIDIKDQVLKHF